MSLVNTFLPPGAAERVTGLVDRMVRSNPLTPRGRMARHAWIRNGRAHIEVRAIHQPGTGDLAVSVEKALEALEGVHWAEINAVVGRVVVAFDQDAIDPEDLFGVINAVEESWSVDNESFPAERPEHPGDTPPLQRSLIALGADVVGIGVITAARFLKLPRVPGEVASVLPFIDSQPRLRQLLGDVVGTPAAELGLALGNAVTQAMAQGPLGLVVDAVHRSNQIAEIRGRQRVWASREPELHDARVGTLAVQASPTRGRPIPLPPGPIEKTADAAGLASLGVFAAVLAASANPRRAANVALCAAPKAGRLGREAFAAQLGRALADRGGVPFDATFLRRLDRVDTVMVEATCLTTGNLIIGTVAPIGAAPADWKLDLETHAYRLFHPDRLARTQRGGGWALGPLADVAGPELPRGLKSQIRRASTGAAAVLGLTRRGALVGLVTVEAELDPLAKGMAGAIRRCGHLFVVAGTSGGLGRRLSADRIVAGGQGMAAAVRALQQEGRVVTLIAQRGGAALQAADCAVGVLNTPGNPPWGADLICGPGLAQAQLVIEATTVAREVSRRSAGLALAGSAAAGVLGLIGSGAQGARRSPLAVNGAALASVSWGAWSGFGLSRRPAPVPDETSPWHVMPAGVALRSLGSAQSGLTPAEVARRRRTGSGPAAPQAWSHFVAAVVDELANPLTPILAAGAGLSAATGSTVDAALVAGVTLGSAIFSAAYQLRTAALLEHLVQAGVVQATVRRSGVEHQIPADQLVPGDVVVLEAGNVVPADVRILCASSLEVDESSLTGESLPVPKSPEPCGGAPVAERTCMLYEGTTIANGTAAGLVVAVGPATEIGRSLHLDAATPPAGVEARLRSLTKVALPVALAGGTGLLGSGLLRGLPLREALRSGVALSVAAVPEGLPFVANAACMAAARRLSGRGALVRNVRTIEALGRVDVLCFDKTGTLTEGRLTLRVISDGATEEPLETLGPSQRAALAAGMRSSPDPAEGALPHATDQAVLDGAAAAGVAVSDGMGGWQRLSELPFDPARGFYLALGASGARRILSVKGAPEALLPACGRWRVADGVLPLDAKARRRIKAQMERLARRGFRVLAVAERDLSDGGPPDLVRIAEAGLGGLDFIGFLAFADRARTSAAGAVAELRRAGVQVRMATGDHPLTARAIAGDLGILEDQKVLTGRELDGLSDEALDALLPAVSVFARVTPTHKVRIVAAYQRLGHRVAMTGDGANDAPAIRLADVGVAIGRHATPAAREAADIVVTDDRLETIIHAIVEGRAMWASLRDALAILLGGNLGEIGFTVAASALTGRSPLNTRQLLLVNLLTDLAPALAIAVQAPRRRSPEELLREGPDASLGSALTRQIALRAVTTAAGATGAWVAARPTGRRARASTIALTALVGSQLGQTLAAGGRSPLVAGTVLASGAALIAVVQTPGVSQFFGCTPLGPVGWATAAGAASLATGASVVLPAAARSIRQRGDKTSATG